jgi:DNA-binding NarL/FixJ family response regulator
MPNRRSLKAECQSMAERIVPIKVFIADDSGMIRDRVSAMLAARGMNVVGYAETAQDAIAGVLAALPDVVVLDAQLQGGNGLQVLRVVRQEEPQIAFVVFSNNAGPAYRERYQREGAQRFLDKSTEFDQLIGAVEDASGAANS